MPASTELKTDFPLRTAPRILEGFKLPERAHDPAGDWALTYRILTLNTRGATTGRLRIDRRAQRGGALMKLHIERPIGVGRRVTSAEILCRGDALATPVRWSFTSESIARGGQPIAHTRLNKAGVTEGAGVNVVDNGRRSRIAVAGPWAINWALFEAVPRLPREPFDPIRFTLLDHFDQIKRNQVLSYRGSTTVRLGARRVRKQHWVPLEKGRIRKTRWALEGGGQVRVHAYDHLGDGIVPWVYWVDEQGRLLFAISGLEGYALDANAT